MDEFQGFQTVERVLLNRSAQFGIPANGSIELLPLCNMNCDMCYVRLSKSEMEAQGRLRTGNEWLSIGKEMARAGTLFLLLTGGEPLLHPDFKEIYLGLKKMGMILTINTNATLINEEWAEFFGKNKPRRINITLYGADNEAYEKLCHYPGGFDRVVNSVILLRNYGIDVRLGCSITPANVQDLSRVFDIAKQLDAFAIADTYMFPSTRERKKPFNMQSRLAPEAAAAAHLQEIKLEKGIDVFRIYREQMLHEIDAFVPKEEEPCTGSCMAGKCSFNINWQGLLRPCVMTSEPAASVFEVGFAEAWRQVREAYSSVRFCAKCSNCSLRPLCPTCPVACKLESGDHMGVPEYLCRYAAESERLLRISLEEDAHE